MIKRKFWFIIFTEK